MRTLFAKILLWFWCTLAITVVGSAFISALIVNRNASDQQSPGARLVTFNSRKRVSRMRPAAGRAPGVSRQRAEDLRRAGHSHG